MVVSSWRLVWAWLVAALLAGPEPTQAEGFHSRKVMSASTCIELGWTNAAKYGSSLVCGESDKLPGGCSGLLSYAAADALCESASARLCTLEEMHDDEPRGSGCSYDFEELWTSTNCTMNGGLSYGRMTGASSLGPAGNCTDVADLHHVRCCADHIPPTPAPTQSPAPTRGTFVTQSVSSCLQLGWTNREKYGDPSVCGESDHKPTLGGCSGAIAFPDAIHFCEAAGGRLCSVRTPCLAV